MRTLSSELDDSKAKPLLQTNILKNSLLFIKNSLFSNRKMSLNLLGLFLLYALISLLEPILLNIFLAHIDFFNLAQEWQLPIFLGGICLIMNISLEYARQQYTVFASGKMAFQISKAILQDFLFQEVFVLSQYDANDCYTRMYAIEQVFYRWIQQLFYFMSDGIFLILHLLMMFIFSWPLAILELLFMILMGFSHQYGLKRYFHQSQEIAAEQQEHLSFFLEIFRNLVSIKVFHKESTIWQLWQMKMRPYWKGFLKNDFFQGQVLLSISSLRKLNGLLIALGGLYLVAHHHLHLGLLVGFLVLKSQSSATFESIFKRLMQWQYLKTPLIRLEDLLGPLECRKKNVLKLHIELKNLNYFTNKYLSKIFYSGKKYLIKGPSGCGKTTLLKSILGIHKPLEGQVMVAGDLGVVLQNDSLLPGTILENITFFSEEIDVVLFEQVCHLVDLKLDENDGVEFLSQGEQQRVLIARALYSQPAWLILDEATCHLDSLSETQLIKNLMSLPVGLIMVSHQLNLSQGFDECLELD